MTTLTPQQKRLHDANIVRLQYQRVFGNEKASKRPPPSLLDLVENVSAKNVAAIPLQRVL
jgi:hypothetical protein